MNAFISLQFRNKVETWNESSSRGAFKCVKKYFLKTMSYGPILAPQGGTFLEILQLDHFLK